MQKTYHEGNKMPKTQPADVINCACLVLVLGWMMFQLV